MTLTVNEIKELLVADLPPGATDLYDIETTSSKVSRIFTGLAQAIKQFGYDEVAALFLETNPVTIVQDIPDWENASGLSSTKTALHGTTDQRRNQIIGQLRGSGDLSLDAYRAIAEAFFRYQDPSRILIAEPNRDNLRALHTYMDRSVGTVVLGTPVIFLVDLSAADDYLTTDMGVIISFDFKGAHLEDVQVAVGPPLLGATITTPPGYFGVGNFTSSTNIKLYLQDPTFTPQFPAGPLQSGNYKGRPFNNLWFFAFATTSHNYTVGNVGVFVEGMGRAVAPKVGEGLSASMFYWSPIAESTLLGPQYDLVGANEAIVRLKPAHTIGNVGYIEEKTVLVDYPTAFAGFGDFNSIWGTGNDNLYIATSAGNMLRFDGAVWNANTDIVSGTVMKSVKGAGINNVYAVGNNATVIKNDGFGWTNLTPVGAVDIKDVAVFDDGSAITVGLNGTIQLIAPDGTFTSPTPPVATTLNAIYTSRTDEKTNIWVVGNAGVILRSIDGVTFTSVTSPTVHDLLSITGSGPNAMYASGKTSTLIKWDGISWTIAPITAPGDDLNTVAMCVADPNDVWIGATAGDVYHKSQFVSSFTLADISSTTHDLLGSWMGSSRVLWMVGKSGTIIRFAPYAIFPDSIRAIPDACFPS